MKEPLEKDYIGDSVYIEDNGYGVTLTTENGLGASNIIVMEPEVIQAFLRYIKKMVAHHNFPEGFCPRTFLILDSEGGAEESQQ